MSKKYYIAWKDATCNGVNPEWIFMTGKDFYKFIKKPENKNRYFIALDDRVCRDADIITMECTKERFVEWRVQKNHENYLDRYEREHELVSMSSYISDSESITYEEVIADETIDIESEVIKLAKNHLLESFFKGLSEDDKELLNQLYIENVGLTEREVCRRLNLPRKTINNRKLNIRKKLKIYLAQNGF